MGKISPVSSKYIVNASIEIVGVVDRPDVIGAIFGQTEGLLGSELELRELQRSGRIGRIEVNVEFKNGKTQGEIIIPSSLDKAETAIVGAALEIIQRIGPCNAKIHVESIEDVRIGKRQFVIERAKELLRAMVEGVMPDSQELADEVSEAVRVMEITTYGKEKIPCGPAIAESEELIIVEGRADVINLLKHGFKNTIAVGGTGVPKEVAELSKQKETTVFVDGDRGGDLIIKELLNVGEIDFIVKAPDGKELEELTKKEIHKALRSKISTEQYELDTATKEHRKQEIRHQDNRRPDNKVQDNRSQDNRRPDNKSQDNRSQDNRSQDNRSQDNRRPDNRPQERNSDNRPQERSPERQDRTVPPRPQKKPKGASEDEKAKFKEMIEDLVGTRAALILDDKMSVLGKVPVSELQSTVKSLSNGIHAIVFDGVAEKDLVAISERSGVKFLVAMDSKVKDSKLGILTNSDL